jgi:D-alanyl-D-alanine-carboxypeptidase/D-alanyl-D-alanine-endopeptidase
LDDIERILKARAGTVAYIINQNESKILSYGTLGRNNSNKLSGDTIFEIGSITKVFTVTLISHLVSKGIISLSDPIRELLSLWVTIPEYNSRQMTVLHLATHTSGLPRVPLKIILKYLRTLMNLERNTLYGPYANYTKQDLYNFLSRHKLKRPRMVMIWSRINSFTIK